MMHIFRNLSGVRNLFGLRLCVFLYLFLCLCTRIWPETVLRYLTSREVSDSKLGVDKSEDLSYTEIIVMSL